MIKSENNIKSTQKAIQDLYNILTKVNENRNRLMSISINRPVFNITADKDQIERCKVGNLRIIIDIIEI